MPETFNQAEMDYFAAEDVAIDRVFQELQDPAKEWKLPKEEAEKYKKLMQHSGTAVIYGDGFHISRSPDEVFKIIPDKTSHADPEIEHAA